MGDPVSYKTTETGQRHGKECIRLYPTIEYFPTSVMLWSDIIKW